MRKKSVSIEFTGVAGVEKSTLIKEIMSLLEKENIPFNDLTTFRGEGSLYEIFNLFKGVTPSFFSRPNVNIWI